MRKYLYIYKSEVMSTLQYITNILFNIIAYIMLIFIFINLWNYIYDDTSQVINGYTKDQMIWYVIVTEILWSASGGRKHCRKISDDVRGGNIAYNMNKPYSYISYVISSHLGETTIKAIMTLIIGISMGFIFLKTIPTISLLKVVTVIISGILAIVINTILVTSIGLLSFFMEDSNPIYWVYSKMLLILGTLFPIEFFPGIFGDIIKFSPIYVTCYGPAKLFVDFDIKNAIYIFVAQLIYLVISLGLCYTLYSKGVKKINVNGG